MKRNDFLLNLFAGLACLLLGAAGGFVYAQRGAIERSIKVLQKDNINPADLRYIAVGKN